MAGPLQRYIYDRPIIPIDLQCDDWVVAYNLLRERKTAASVITANMVDALAYVWGAGSTDATPLFAHTATMVFRALYERKLTLSDALYILEHAYQDFRTSLARAIEDLVVPVVVCYKKPALFSPDPNGG